MNKKELHAEVEAICTRHAINDEAKAELLKLVQPKKGGARIDIAEIAVFDENGVVAFILDSYIDKWVPLHDAEGNENFYAQEDKELGWSRFSRTAEKARKDSVKKFKATKDAVLTDVMSEAISQAEARELMEAAEEGKSVWELPEDFVCYDERPATTVPEAVETTETAEA